MTSLPSRLRRALRPQPLALPTWARRLFVSALTPAFSAKSGEAQVWTLQCNASVATITDQFKAHAGEYHRRYAASDHFEALFRQALDATTIRLRKAPRILDLGSGSGANSVVPCRRLFPGARVVATDLSADLLRLLAAHVASEGAQDEVVCVVMDAMGEHLAPGRFDLVTGSAILHHLERPRDGLAAAARARRPGGVAIFLEPFLGHAVLRLAYERILAEAALRNDPLADEVAQALAALIADVAARSAPDISSPAFAALDDKWLFSRARIETAARAADFSSAQFVPHNDHPTLYRDTAEVQLRLATGLEDLTLPGWALAILDAFDAAMPLQAKRELMLEGTIVLTKA